MLLYRFAELTDPFAGIYRRSGCLSALFSVLIHDGFPLIHGSGRQIKYKQVLILMMNHLPDDLISVRRIPLHHVHDHGEKHAAGDDLRFPRSSTPLERIPIVLRAGANHQLFLLTVNQNLHILHIRGFLETYSIDAELTVCEGDRRFQHVRIILTPCHLKTVVTEIGILLCLIRLDMRFSFRLYRHLWL